MIEALLAAASLTAADCAPLQRLAEATLNGRGEVATGPVSYVGLPEAPGCTVRLRSDASPESGVFEIASRIDAAVAEQGWVRDPGADADGAGATAAGYGKGELRLTVTVERDSPEAGPYAIVLGLRPAH